MKITKLSIHIFVTSLLLTIPAVNQCGGAENKTTGADWEKAETKWEAFAKEHMERMREHDATLPLAKLPNYKFDMEWIEVKSHLITKYLPDYKIYADRRFEFVLDKQGHIICLGETWPLGRPFKSSPDFEVKGYSDFIQGLGIPIEDIQTAIDMVWLRDIVQGNGYVDDEELEKRVQNWKYEARGENGVWFIEMRYIGPPASIFEPPIWKIIVDENNKLRAIKETHLGFCDVNGDGDCNSDDVKVIEKLIGECLPGSTKFNVIADMDHDDCITETDRELLLREISE